MSRISAAAFGSVGGRAATLFTLSNKSGVQAAISDFGATLVKLVLPDHNGKLEDCVLGYDDVSGYAGPENPYFGAIVGRVANRIAGGKFALEGKEYSLECNNGPNSLHGGPGGFHSKIWESRTADVPGEPASLRLSYTSADGEEGFPGELRTSVTYTLGDDDELSIEMEARVTGCSTIVNLANHSYFNLDGHTSGDILGTRLFLNCPALTPIDETSIPLGALAPVEGTPFDFLPSKGVPAAALNHSAARTIGERIGDVGAFDKHDGAGGGYDHNLVVDHAGAAHGKLSLVCSAAGPRSGRTMQLYTSAPGVQFYTGNFLGETGAGKEGAAYPKHGGFCLETQCYPDAVNQYVPGGAFTSVELAPGEVYRHSMAFRFATIAPLTTAAAL